MPPPTARKIVAAFLCAAFLLPSAQAALPRASVAPVENLPAGLGAGAAGAGADFSPALDLAPSLSLPSGPDPALLRAPDALMAPPPLSAVTPALGAPAVSPAQIHPLQPDPQADPALPAGQLERQGALSRELAEDLAAPGGLGGETASERAERIFVPGAAPFRGDPVEMPSGAGTVGLALPEFQAGAAAAPSATVPASPYPALAPESFLAKLGYFLRVPLIWGQQMLSNGLGILAVLDMIRWRPLPGGLLPVEHPWVTGAIPGTTRFIWPENIVYATPRKASFAGGASYAPRSDAEIVSSVGRFLAQMVERSASTPEHPEGRGGRMPAGINYIHGPVHYNSGFILFNDFAEGIYHLSDPRFVAEMRRFASETGRELLVAFRERVFDPRQYAYFSAVIRTVLPWMANPNAAPRTEKNTIRAPGLPADDFTVNGLSLWGLPSPYPVVNPISGNWIADVYRLVRAQMDPVSLAALVRPPIEPGGYFQGTYQGTRVEARWPERLLAHHTHKRIRRRGPLGNHFFIDERKIGASPGKEAAAYWGESASLARFIADSRDGRAGELPAALRGARVLLVPGATNRRIGTPFAPTLAWLKSQGIAAGFVQTDPFSAVGEGPNVEAIRSAIEASPEPVVLVGHSRGGVDVVEALRRYPGLKAKVLKVVLLQSPYYGTAWADALRRWPWAARLASGLLSLLGRPGMGPWMEAFSDSEAAGQLTRASRAGLRSSEAALEGVELFSVASRGAPLSRRSFPEWLMGRLLNLLSRGENDGVVAVRDALVRGSRFAILDKMNHWDLVATCRTCMEPWALAQAASEGLLRWIFS